MILASKNEKKSTLLAIAAITVDSLIVNYGAGRLLANACGVQCGAIGSNNYHGLMTDFVFDDKVQL